jgi:4-amino-4-deoxy-L-arabinose transferase-like glycosyltransferase
MKATVVRRWHLGILTVILGLALAVRLLGINYGLPYVYNPDEAILVNHALAFGTGNLNPHFFGYPSLYIYVLFLIYALSYVIGWLAGVFTSTNDFARLFFNDVTLFYLPGRLIAALSGVMSVGMVYLLGRRAYNVRVGLIAAAFLTFSVLHVTYSHFIKTQVPAGLLVIVALGLAWSIYVGKENWRPYLLAGVVAGLGASTIYQAGFVLVSVIMAHVLHWRDSSKNTSEVCLLSPQLLGAVIASFVAFVLTTPFAILDWPTFMSDLSSVGAMYYSGGFFERGTFYPFTSLLASIGSPLGLMALLGLGYALIRRRPIDLILLSQPLFLAGFYMLFTAKEPHHMLMAFPALSLLSASFLVDVVSWFIRPWIPQSVALTLAAMLLLVTPVRVSFQNSFRLALPETRSIAKEWIEENIPPGSKIVMDSGKYYLSTYGPPLRPSRWTLEQLIARAESLSGTSLARREGTRRVGWFGEAEYFRQQLQTLDAQPGYDVIQILHDEASPRADVLTLDEYVSMGVQYAIVTSYVWEQYIPGRETAVRHPDKAGKYRNFYQALQARSTLLKEFSPSDKMAGPPLRIYELPIL